MEEEEGASPRFGNFIFHDAYLGPRETKPGLSASVILRHRTPAPCRTRHRPGTDMIDFQMGSTPAWA